MIEPSELKEHEETDVIILIAEDRFCNELKKQLLSKLQIDCFLRYRDGRAYWEKQGEIEEFLNRECDGANLYRMMYWFTEKLNMEIF